MCNKPPPSSVSSQPPYPLEPGAAMVLPFANGLILESAFWTDSSRPRYYPAQASFSFPPASHPFEVLYFYFAGQKEG
jgi:hypothetical protein